MMLHACTSCRCDDDDAACMCAFCCDKCVCKMMHACIYLVYIYTYVCVHEHVYVILHSIHNFSHHHHPSHRMLCAKKSDNNVGMCCMHRSHISWKSTKKLLHLLDPRAHEHTHVYTMLLSQHFENIIRFDRPHRHHTYLPTSFFQASIHSFADFLIVPVPAGDDA